MTKSTIKKDILLIRDLLGLSQADFAKKLDVDTVAVERWEKDITQISDSNIEKVYAYAFKNDILLNEIKTQLYHESLVDEGNIVVFHGAKNEIQGEIDIHHSRKNNDFGQGFYCGESFEQSSLFVSAFESSRVYVVSFNNRNLTELAYKVNQEWMLTIAYFRGKLKEYKDSKVLQTIINKIDGVDYIVAPIVDNKMFQIIDSFINGEITDEQCKHCLAATNLGYQYVFKTNKALREIKLLEKLYLCKEEKDMYQLKRIDDNKISNTKVKIAKRQYRGQGQYIDDIL